MSSAEPFHPKEVERATRSPGLSDIGVLERWYKCEARKIIGGKGEAHSHRYQFQPLGFPEAVPPPLFAFLEAEVGGT